MDPTTQTPQATVATGSEKPQVDPQIDAKAESTPKLEQLTATTPTTTTTPIPGDRKSTKPETEPSTKQTTTPSTETSSTNTTTNTYDPANPTFSLSPSKQKPFEQLTLKDIFLWRNVYASIVVLLAIQATYTLLHKYEYSIATLLGRVIQCQVLLSLLYVTFLKVKGMPLEFPFGAVQLQEKDFTSAIKWTCETFNSNSQKLIDLLMFKDWVRTVKFVAVVQVVCFLGNRICGLHLLYMLCLYMFTVPKVYEAKKEEIDKIWLKVTDEGKKYALQLYDKLPPDARAKLENTFGTKPKQE
jgi:hypothetical protein